MSALPEELKLTAQTTEGLDQQVREAEDKGYRLVKRYATTASSFIAQMKLL